MRCSLRRKETVFEGGRNWLRILNTQVLQLPGVDGGYLERSEELMLMFQKSEKKGMWLVTVLPAWLENYSWEGIEAPAERTLGYLQGGWCMTLDGFCLALSSHSASELKHQWLLTSHRAGIHLSCISGPEWVTRYKICA